MTEPMAVDPPDEAATIVMQAVDSYAPEWRALIHEFGINIVEAVYSECGPDGGDAEEGRSMLEVWRSRRQDEWLATNFISKRTRASFGLAA